MKATDPHNYRSLQRQLQIQKEHQWDLEDDINWARSIDFNKRFLPMDDNNIAFPGASAEQQLALSQLFGLIVNTTISEMEESLPSMKFSAWEQVLRSYPANPEIIELGEMFYEEEAKHAKAFNKFQMMFCSELGIEPEDLRQLLPQAFGSFFQSAVLKNSLAGGHAFWWVVANVEEISIDIYHRIKTEQDTIDPLFFELHQKHTEEEARHANYAHLMLGVIRDRTQNMRRRLFRKTDFVFSQIVATPWVVSELSKIFEVHRFKGKHPFFDVLASCLPLFQKMPKHQLVKQLFVGAPYISWLLNPNLRRRHQKLQTEHGAWGLPYPAPEGASRGGTTHGDNRDSRAEYGLADQQDAG